MKLRLFSALLLAGLLTAAAAFARQPVDELYDKAEYRIAMRDSVKLYTAVYTPKTDAKAPILIFRTPYGCAPYGPGVPFGPSGQPFPGQGAFHISPNDPIEDVTYGDMAKVVRSNVPFYMLVFYRMKNFNRKRFNFAAFLFGPAWFLYRKQYKGGFLYLGINMALSAISILLSKFCAAPVMEAAYQSLGIPSSAIITNDTMNQVVQTIMNMGIGSIILFLLPWITTVASFVLAIIAGVKANKWYMNHCLRIAREVRNTTPSSVEQDALYEKKGGVNIALAMILIAINVALTYVPTLFS